MKTLAALILACFTVLSTASAQTSKTDASLEEVRKEAQLKPAEHLLNGTSMNYFYQNGGGIRIEFYNGMLKYKWIVGPRKGNGNQDLAYNSRKVGPKTYLASCVRSLSS